METGMALPLFAAQNLTERPRWRNIRAPAQGAGLDGLSIPAENTDKALEPPGQSVNLPVPAPEVARPEERIETR